MGHIVSAVGRFAVGQFAVGRETLLNVPTNEGDCGFPFTSKHEHGTKESARKKYNENKGARKLRTLRTRNAMTHSKRR